MSRGTVVARSLLGREPSGTLWLGASAQAAVLHHGTERRPGVRADHKRRFGGVLALAHTLATFGQGFDLDAVPAAAAGSARLGPCRTSEFLLQVHIPPFLPD